MTRSRRFGGLAALVVLIAGCGGSGTQGSEPDAGGGPADGRPGADLARQPDFWPLSDLPRFADQRDAELLGDIPQGHFGAPCTANDECLSGWCIESYQGTICTQECLESCPEGYSCRAVMQTYPDAIFICLPNILQYCKPCFDDAQCIGGGLCLDIDGEGRCSGPCDEKGLCPDTYHCAPIQRADMAAPLDVCLPDTGSCACTADTAGQMKACWRDDDQGRRCYGFQQCDGETGWLDCDAPAPIDEACNGLDDDCNGTIDEDLGSMRCEVAVEGLGTCYGTQRCYGQLGWICDAPTPTAELCDGQDNDCDGATDEDFKVGDVYGLTDHCGGCNVGCAGTIPNGTARCDPAQEPPRCVVDTCAPGYFPVQGSACLPATGTGCMPCLSDADCDFASNRCAALDKGNGCVLDCGPQNPYGTPEGQCEPGYTCQPDDTGAHCYPTSGSCTCMPQNQGEDRLCMRQNEFGRCLGSEVCDPAAGWVGCSAAEPAPEVCNDADDDCNGLIDDVAGLGGECSRAVPGVGTCVGLWQCGAGQPEPICSAAEPQAETCNGRDDDCDGTTDEAFPQLGSACTVGQGACARQGVYVCAGNGLAARCNATAGTPQPELCNNLDDNCDGDVDEPFKDAATGLYATDEHCGLCNFSCAGAILFASDTACRIDLGEAYCAVLACEPGYYQPPDSDRLCIPENATDCSPCAQDEHCEALAGGLCEPSDGGRFCTRACAGPLFCDEGYECVDGRCVPLSRSCTCLAAHTGAVRICRQTTTFGTCIGTQTCDPTLTPGWSPCTAAIPAEETCNGNDDDCNGLVDDGVAEPADPCAVSNAAGTCTGQWRCGDNGSGVEWWCNAATPAEEACDYEDNDCDGQTDEDYRAEGIGPYVGFDHCGACGVSCVGAIPNATAQCTLTPAGGARCEVGTCDPGFYPAGPLTCLPVGEDLCTPCLTDDNCPTPGDLCLSLDGGQYCGRDCAAGNLHGTPAGECPDGFTCLTLGGGVRQCEPTSASCTCLLGDLGETRTCIQQNPNGVCYGQQVCDPAAGWSACSAAIPAAEICNAVDDNCNGLVDDVNGIGQACSNEVPGVGTCNGTRQCVTGTAGLVCSARTPTAEACNYLDDDCDNLTDETFPDVYTPCVAGEGACQRYGVFLCAADGAAAECNVEAGEAGAERCNGIDDDCDTFTDETFPLKGTVCTVGTGACTRSGVVVCTTDGLGTQCSVEPGPIGAEACNGIDDDCDTLTDEAFPDKGAVCTVGTGACQRAGVMVCTESGLATVCNAVQGLPQPETCNGSDDNCDGAVDPEGAGGCTPYYQDADGDTYGAVGVAARCLCAPSGVFRALQGRDCDDTEFLVNPGMYEVCNGRDDDCDGGLDEGVLSECGNCDVFCRIVDIGLDGDEPFDPTIENSSGVAFVPDDGLVIDTDNINLTFLWIANSPESTVSQLSTVTGWEEGRYRVCNDPSRTAVDLFGNMYVACRGDDGVAKVIQDRNLCPDRNGNGVIDTARDQNGDHRITGSEILAYGQDECVAWVTQPLGGDYDGIARGIAVDRNNRPWVGFYNSLPGRGFMVAQLNPDTGQILQEVRNLNAGTYGIVIDHQGRMWLSGRNGGWLTRLDIENSPPTVHSYKPTLGYGNGAEFYGIAVDKNDDVWIANCWQYGIWKFDPDTTQFSYFGTNYIPSDRGITRGVAASKEGLLLIGHSHAGRGAVTKVNLNVSPPTFSTIWLHASDRLDTVGVAFDYQGYAWGVNNIASTATKIDHVNGTVIGHYPVGANPYTYSDMTGYNLHVFTAPDGYYRHIVAGWPGYGTEWLSLDVVADVPVGTYLKLRLRSADTIGALWQTQWSPFIGPFPPQTFPIDLSQVAGLDGNYMEVEVWLFATQGTITPTVSALNVSYTAAQ